MCAFFGFPVSMPHLYRYKPLINRPVSMSFHQKTLRSFVTAEGKLVLCNEPFFAYFGHCTQHLIGKSVEDVFPTLSANEIMQAVQCCQSNPAQSFTVDLQTICQQGCCSFRWMIYAEQWQGRVSGIHLVGEVLENVNAS